MKELWVVALLIMNASFFACASNLPTNLEGVDQESATVKDLLKSQLLDSGIKIESQVGPTALNSV
eukprot:CAMPEP_0170479626 /NCGR_PEP_ID=MMETSP0208-20121228/790_1 /TAXON_ID=197538 /ORGANISM="Strombidium inclinatum, Strain S3" /LENGTH=64 /DNA_ID=CAMNT_0010752055 /DNA_START=21 /DNA_END=215 /DNA_ORIENTATION=+